MAAATWVGILPLWFAIFGGMGQNALAPLPPLPPDDVLARIAPAECLVYLNSAGRAEPSADSTNQIEQFLAEPEVQMAVAHLRTQFQKWKSQNAAGGEPGDLDAEIMKQGALLLPALLQRPWAFYVAKAAMGPAGVDARGGLVVNLGKDSESLLTAWKKLEQALVEKSGLPPVTEVELAGGSWRKITLPAPAPAVFWGTRGSYLLLVVGEAEAAELLGRARTEAPAWLTKLRQDLPVPRPAFTTYVGIQGIRQSAEAFGLPPQATQIVQLLGLDAVENYATVLGLDETGVVTRTTLQVAPNATGLFAPSPDKPLTAADLASIPRDAELALVARRDLASTYRTIRELAEKGSPDGGEAVAGGIDQFEQILGLSIEQDLLAALGDTWRVFTSSQEGGSIWTGITIIADVRDEARLQTSLDKLVQLGMAMQGNQRQQVQIATSPYGDATIHYLQGYGLPMPVAPAWTIHQGKLIVGLFPQTVRAHLRRKADAPSLAELPEVKAALEDTDHPPVLITYEDGETLLKLSYPWMQIGWTMIAGQLRGQGVELDAALLPSAAVFHDHSAPGVYVASSTDGDFYTINRTTDPLGGAQLSGAAPVMVALLLPAVQAARDAARRTASLNNLKQLALCWHIYHDSHRAFPSDIYSEDGKPLLSWRVKILPYLEERALYEQFHLDEPWDSPHNKPLLAHMPNVFHQPQSINRPQDGVTRYLAPSGDDAILNGDKKSTIAMVRDGTSNTIMLVTVPDEAAVPWTKPEDFDASTQNLHDALLPAGTRQFQAAFCDGSVRNIAASVSEMVLRAVITPRGGEVVNGSEIEGR